MKSNIEKIPLTTDIPKFKFEDKDWYWGGAFHDVGQIYVKQGGKPIHVKYLKDNFFRVLEKELTKLFGKGDFFNLFFNTVKPDTGILPHTDFVQFEPATPRAHIPIVTNEDVFFMSNGEEIHMEMGYMYLFDNFKTHSVSNYSDKERIHLVIDWKPDSSKELDTLAY